MNSIKLKPEIVFHFFEKILQIPRESKKEDKIVQYIADFAKEQKLEINIDSAKNILIKKPATKGFENFKPVILQSHLDMVCVPKEYDFEKDPIKATVKDGWMTAEGTTLGADNGIGIAIQLALLASTDIEHGPIACLFTTDEETGLFGASNINPDFLKSGELLLNLDSEEWGEFCIGCAGGRNTTAVLKYKPTPAPKDYYWFKVTIKLLRGGHSGCEIDKGYGNSLKIVDRYLWTVREQHPDLVVASFVGGAQHNVIASVAEAVVGFPASEPKEDVPASLNELISYLKTELPPDDQLFKFTVDTVKAPATVIDKATGNKLIDLLYAVHHGVWKMSRDIKGLVQTSSNLASIEMTPNATITITTSQRSALDSEKTDICNTIKAAFLLAGAEVSQSAGYSEWTPNPQSKLLGIAKKVYKSIYNEEPEVRATHGGLETGLFAGQNPKLDMISFGPTIKGAHSPSERVEIASVEKCWEFVLALLKELK